MSGDFCHLRIQIQLHPLWELIYLVLVTRIHAVLLLYIKYISNYVVYMHDDACMLGFFVHCITYITRNDSRWFGTLNINRRITNSVLHVLHVLHVHCPLLILRVDIRCTHVKVFCTRTCSVSFDFFLPNKNTYQGKSSFSMCYRLDSRIFHRTTAQIEIVFKGYNFFFIKMMTFVFIKMMPFFYYGFCYAHTNFNV